MAVVTGDKYLEQLVSFVEEQAGPLIEGSVVLKLNPVGFHYVQSRLEALHELESLLSGAPVDYLRAYVSDLGDYRALEQLRRILMPLTSLKVVSVLPPPVRDPTPLSFVLFGRLKVLELRGCDLSTSAARGLLELRHTLEKIICHNSTDALRHVFASRITEIKDSPQWNRLSFASCACNNLVLMDDSLQLLPVIETLDLSRNKFTKLDNLRKCTKLKHLDLCFNHLRTIESLNKVSNQIVKLVLRNNALTTLRGIENLKSLEGLDVSYNVISKFSELAYPASLPSLRSLWLEGNPMCCARWYRPKVFSYFAYPEKISAVGYLYLTLKLDDKEISNRELWKRKLIIASKHKQPASYGFYSPALHDAADEGRVNRKKKRVSHLASIENEDENASTLSDQDSLSCENDSQNGEVSVLSDDEAGIVDLMNRVELMKKERSVLWLREFKEWIEHSSGSSLNMSKNVGFKLHHPRGENYIRNKPIKRRTGDRSRYVSDSILASGDESSINILESDSSFADVSFGSHSRHYFDHICPLIHAGMDTLDGTARTDSEILESNSPGGASSAFPYARTYVNTSTNLDGDLKDLDVNISSLSAIDKTSESHSTSFPSSPPHYQEDILQRRLNLVEEIMQLSAESYSVASSDSNTSGSEINYTEFEQSMPEVDPSCKKSLLTVEEKLSSTMINGQKYESSQGKENGSPSSDSFAAQTFRHCWNSFSSTSIDSATATAHCARQGSCLLEEENKKAKKRVVSLKEESNMASKIDALQSSKEELSMPCANSCFVDETDKYSKCLTTKSYDFIESYFASNIADSKVNETCSQVIFCNCMLSWESAVAERAVAVLFSSHQKFYVLLVGVADDGSVTILSLLGSHKVREVQEVVLGLALQVVRLNMEGGRTYLFIIRTIERSRMLLHAMQVVDGGEGSKNCPLKSLEQVQVTLFEKLICGGSKVSILQYAMVLVKRNKTEEERWFPRSLFVVEGYVVLCIEDLVQMQYQLHESMASYFTLDLCGCITDISELLIHSRDICVTLVLDCVMSEFCPSTNKKIVPGGLKLKLKWFSEDSLVKFVALLKAIYAGKTMSPLLVRCI